jgi:DNA-binding FadR family transcriptional regulator
LLQKAAVEQRKMVHTILASHEMVYRYIEQGTADEAYNAMMDHLEYFYSDICQACE